jgi:hypothetical protein
MPLTAAQLTTLKANQATIDKAKTALQAADITQLPGAQTTLDNAVAAQDTFVGTLVADTVVTPPPTPPAAPTFTAKATGVNEATLSWTGVSPTMLGRNGVDTLGTGPWNTGPLTGEPASGSSKFENLVPGTTYTYTLTGADGVSLTCTLLQPAEVTPPTPPAPASGKLLSKMSIYCGPGGGGLAATKVWNAEMGQPAYVMDFTDGTTWETISDPSWFCQQWAPGGYKMIWAVPILPNTFTPNSNPTVVNGSTWGLTQGATGAYDQYFVDCATVLVANGQGSTWIRLAWEFNGGWFPWAAGGALPSLKEYLIHIVEAFRSVAGADFKFIAFNPTLGDMGVGDITQADPGKAYNDAIATDVYDQAWATYPGESVEWNNILTVPQGLDWVVSYAASQGLPVIVAEGGLGNNEAPSGEQGQAYSNPNNEAGGGDDAAFALNYLTWVNNPANNVLIGNWYDVGAALLTPTSHPLTYAQVKTLTTTT